MAIAPDLKDIFDKLASNSDYFIANPSAIEEVKKAGLPIKEKFITNEEFIEELFLKKKEQSKELLKRFPLLDTSIANSTIQALYEELRETFTLGIFGSAIILSLILLELALKYRLFKERLKSNPNTTWELIEQIDLGATIKGLEKAKLITLEEKKKLDEFSVTTRNPYIHYNIKKLVSDMILTELPAVELATGKITIHKNVIASEIPAIWEVYGNLDTYSENIY